MYKAKGPLKEISRNTRYCLTTVKNTVRKAELRDPNQRDLPRSNRPRKFTRNQDNHLYQ